MFTALTHGFVKGLLRLSVPPALSKGKNIYKPHKSNKLHTIFVHSKGFRSSKCRVPNLNTAKMSEEKIPSTRHLITGKPRVSFYVPDLSVDLPKQFKRSSDHDDESNFESGKFNSAYINKENIHPVCMTEWRNYTNELELIQVNVENNIAENKIEILSKQRLSIAAAGDAIIVRGAHKSYKSGTPVLNGLNMTVPCGSIYSLLGSSGCGKTTLLSCIVGQRMLDSGEIYLFGKPVGGGTKNIGIPGKNVGYMPQDISLYVEFSIQETLTYFGTLSGLKKEEIQNEIVFLMKLLDLPVGTRRVGTLSGGQQRRVSFAAALIHSPELLILDEPTVGVDPLMRHNIWIHLHKLVCMKRTTVIITTHYIEECRQADNIGIMRNGRLLTERQTNDLLAEHGSTNLEQITLDLSRKEDSDNLDPKELCTDNTSISEGIVEHKMASVLRESEPSFKDSLVRIRALTGKNFVILFRNPLLLFFVVLLAAVILIITCISLGPDPTRMSIGLVNHELDYHSICPKVSRIPDECNVENLSCHFLMNIPKGFLNFKHFEDETEAIRATQDGSVWGYIMFPKDFSDKLYERVSSGSYSSQVIVRLDETNKQISNAIKKILYDAYKDFTRIFLSDCGFDPRQAESPLMYHQPIFGRDDTNFREFLAPGAVSGIIFFFPIITSSIRYIREKKNGVLDRSIVGGVQTWEILVAYSISEFFVLVVQSLLNYSVLTFIFEINIMGNHFLVILIFILSAYVGVSMGFLLGSICTEEIQAAMLAMAAFFPNFILSGLIWPIEGLPVILQKIVQVFPCTLSAEAVRSIVSRGWEFTHPNVWPGFVVLTAYIFGYFLLTILFHKIFKR